MTGIDLIAAERSRQINEEGWTPEHDDSHQNGEMAKAAACYAVGEDIPVFRGTLQGVGFEGDPRIHRLWPWEAEWWKPSADRGRNLVKAGALIAAELDRLLREDEQSESMREDFPAAFKPGDRVRMKDGSPGLEVVEVFPWLGQRKVVAKDYTGMFYKGFAAEFEHAP